MKKKLEADLMSIAHRVLQMKNKSDIDQLCIETQKLYEKLSVLRFVEEHFGGVKPTIGQAEVVAKMKQFFEENHLSDVKPAMTKIEIVAEVDIEEETVEEEIVEEEIVAEEVDEDEEDEIAEVESNSVDEEEFNETEPDEEGEGEIEEEVLAEEATTKIENIGFVPSFELDLEDQKEPEISKKIESIQISFEELLGGDYSETLFVKADSQKDEPSLDFELPIPISIQEEYKEELISENTEENTVPVIEKQISGISVGLNDRIAFVKHLFGNSDEDYSRVMNQLITFDSFEEAQSFIEDMVKPDYGDWEGKEDYEQRFIEIIEKKFA
ncbi:MAG TPA: hypothetical protein VN182_07635 [Flavobacterium sp.]|nr:hypothetical protein [Flavobacterium sp.]